MSSIDRFEIARTDAQQVRINDLLLLNKNILYSIILHDIRNCIEMIDFRAYEFEDNERQNGSEIYHNILDGNKYFKLLNEFDFANNPTGSFSYVFK